MNDKREVTTQQGEDEAKKNNLMFVETSAKLGHNVKTLFKRIAQALPGMEGSDTAGQAENQSEFCPLSGCVHICILPNWYADIVLVIDVKSNNTPAGQEGCAC